MTEPSSGSEPDADGDAGVDAADRAYRRAIFAGDPSLLDSALADLGERDDPAAEVARGMLVHCRILLQQSASRAADADAERACFEHAIAAYADSGDIAGRAWATFWLGCCRQVIDSDAGAAVPGLQDAERLARLAGSDLTLSYALRHLAADAAHRGELAQADAALTESTRLRRALGFDEGVAANLVVRASIAADRGDRDEARRAATEAIEVGDRGGAPAMAAAARGLLDSLG